MRPWRLAKYLWALGGPLLACSPTALAQNYYAEHAIGWHWYGDPKLMARPNVKHLPLQPIARMRAVQQALELALDQAVLEPTPENVRAYIILQNQMSERAGRFARVWQWALLQDPSLDFSLLHPTTQVGRAVYLDELARQQERAIKSLAKRSGLFFFYHSQCPYCQRFAPIVKRFSERYGIAVVPITTDGVALPEFPNSRFDQGQAQKFQVRAEPALFTVDPYTSQAVPVAYGLVSESELRQRVLDIALARGAKP